MYITGSGTLRWDRVSQERKRISGDQPVNLPLLAYFLSTAKLVIALQYLMPAGGITEHTVLYGENGDNLGAVSSPYRPTDNLLYTQTRGDQALSDPNEAAQRGRAASLTDSLHTLAIPAGDAEVLDISYPQPYMVFKLDTGTGTGHIRVRVTGQAGQTVEISYAGGAWENVGDIPQDGILDTTTEQPAGQGTFEVRVQGSATIYSIDPVGVGIVIDYSGESNIDGRGDDIAWLPTGAGAGMFLASHRGRGWQDDTFANHTIKSPVRLLAMAFAEKYGCPVGLRKNSQGGTTHQAFEKANPNSGSMYNLMVSVYKEQTVASNFHLLQLGGNDAAFLQTSEQEFYDFLLRLVQDWQDDINLEQLYVILPGRERQNQAINTIRAAMMRAVANSPLIELGGAAHHIAVDNDDGQEVHWLTEATKQKVAANIMRYIDGDGAGPTIASATLAGSVLSVVLTDGVAPMTGHDDPTGFYVKDNDGEIPITLSSGEGMQIDLQLARGPVGTPRLSFARAGDAEGATFADSGTPPQPPHPIYDLEVGRATAQSIVEERASFKTLTLGLPHPNPSFYTSTIVLRTAQSEAVKVYLVDLMGRTLGVVYNGYVQAFSPHAIEINTNKWAIGTYLILAESRSARQWRMLSVIR